MSARRIALEALSDILDQGAYANLRLGQLLSHEAGSGHRFVSALVYTTLEHLLYLDHIIQAYAPKRQKHIIANILRLGACELLYMNTPAHAVVSEYVSLCKASGKAAVSGFVNAVLRRIDRERNSLPALPSDSAQRLSIEYSYPLWIVNLWLQECGYDTALSLLSRPTSTTCIRAQYPNTYDDVKDALPTDVKRGSLDQNACHLNSPFDITGLSIFREGKLTIQGEGAMLACRALGDTRRKRILDACSAPGGKSAYIASLSENTADITCFELHEHRCELLKSTFERLGVRAQVTRHDASILQEEYVNQFDAVLLDVPCSGLGLLSEKPDLRYGKSFDDIVELERTQKKLLDTCCNYVKIGGILVYSTCTISRRENEQQVSSFLGMHPEFRPDPLPFADAHEIQLLPHVHGTEGFYIARMKRCI